MSNFNIKVALFLIPLVIIGGTMEFMLRQIPNVYQVKKNYLDNNAEKIEVLFLGNSHSFFGLNPAFINFNTFNAAYVSQTLDYDLEILKKYENKWTNLKFIVIPVSYFSLFDKLSESAESWRVKDYSIYYQIRTNKYLPYYTEMLSGQLSVKFRRLWSYYINKSDNIACTELGWGTAYKSTNTSTDLIKEGMSAAKRHRRIDDKQFGEMCLTLDSIIAFSEKHHCRLILFTPPAYESYRKNLSENQLQRTVKAVSNRVNANCLYFNLMADEGYTINDFYDPDHLNEAGAKKLTAQIYCIINKDYRMSNRN